MCELASPALRFLPIMLVTFATTSARYHRGYTMRKRSPVSTTLVIIGLPSSGKTTVFNALSAVYSREPGAYSASPDEPNVATVKVPDDPSRSLDRNVSRPSAEYQPTSNISTWPGLAKGHCRRKA